MRVTDKTTIVSIQRQIETNKKRLNESTEQVSSGNKINKLSDDPLVLRQTLRNTRQEEDLEQYGKNLLSQRETYNEYENTFNQGHQILVDLKSKMVGLSGAETFSQDAISELLTTINHLEEELLALANNKSGDAYIFSGTKTDTPPFAADGTYSGNDTVNRTEIMPGVMMESNLTGDRAFGGVGYTDGVNVFEVLNQIRTTLSSGQTQNIADDIDDVSQAMEQMRQEQIKVGVRLSRVEMSTNALENLKTGLAEKRTENEGVDYVEAITQFKAQEYALEAAMQTNSRLLGVSLMDYLR